MIPEDSIVLSPTVHIPLSEIEIRFIRSSGPGGQHVNKTSSQAEIVFDLFGSQSVSEADREWLQHRLANKLDSEGKIRITAQTNRSQLQNRKEAIEKLRSLLTEALKRPKKRRKTKPTKASVERRLESKKRDSEKKKGRNNLY
jgi:ribosome-associated protein